MQSLLRVLYPTQCVSCDGLVESAAGLCGACWSRTPFLQGHACDACAQPLVGQGDGVADLCDDCLDAPRPWRQGRAALEYRDNAKRMVLQLKHGDRLDLAPPLAQWMVTAAGGLIAPDAILVPVPSHWVRLLTRRYNQAAVLARAIAGIAGVEVLPDALQRARRTDVQEGMSREARFANMKDAIVPHPRRAGVLAGRRVVLVDDVFTSGATFAAATEACLAAGAADICVLALARVVKAP